VVIIQYLYYTIYDRRSPILDFVLVYTTKCRSQGDKKKKDAEEPTGIHPALTTRPGPPARSRSCSTTRRPPSLYLFQPPPPQREHRYRLALEYLFPPLFRFVQLVNQLDRPEMANTAIGRRPARRGHRDRSLGIFLRSNDHQ
jgi:hypothetical protein